MGDALQGVLDGVGKVIHGEDAPLRPLAVGVTFAFLDVSILPAVLFIGVTTFVCSAAGVKVGSVFGARYKKKAELCGGVVLVLIGLKLLLEGLGIL